MTALENVMPDQPGAQDNVQLEAAEPVEAAREVPVSAIERNLMNVAEELGTWLGTAERKTTDFLEQSAIKEQLIKIRDTATRLLAQVEKGRDRSR
jgi:hypothetical protein